jgi:transcriptional antiterminator RfaH
MFDATVIDSDVANAKMRCSTQALHDLKEPLWFCLQAQPKREHIAAESLRRQLEVPCFAPRLRFRKATRRGATWFVEAMFPGYLFAEFVYSDFHRRIASATAVRAVVRFGDYVPIIDASVIEALRRSSTDDAVITIEPELEVGETVTMVNGPLAGMTALITQLHPAKERVRILLEFLGRQLETEAPIARVLPTRRHRGIQEATGGVDLGQ